MVRSHIGRIAAVAGTALALLGAGTVTSGSAHANPIDDTQICVHATVPAAVAGTEVTVAGTNQNGVPNQEWVGDLQYYGNRDAGGPFLEACTWNWWWEGHVNVILYNRANGYYATQYVEIPMGAPRTTVVYFS